MITTRVVTDDFGNLVLVGEIDWPNRAFFSRYVDRLWGLWRANH